MSLLGSVPTHLGRVELHHEDGRFETRGTYTDAIVGTERESVIVEYGADAKWWYSHCEANGAVFAPFPEPISDRIDLQTECPRDAQTSGGVATT